MTPLEIDIILHYWTTPGDYREGNFSAPALREAIDYFREIGLLREQRDRSRSASYEVTERGAMYVKMLQAVPLPIQIWTAPPPYPTPAADGP